MNINQECFVVAIVENNEVKRFHAIDRTSGGCPWWPSRLSQADVHYKKEDAVAVAVDLSEKAKQSPRVLSGGTLFPDTDVQGALDIDNKKPKAEGKAVVMRVVLEPLESYPIHGEIKEPTGYKYD